MLLEQYYEIDDDIEREKFEQILYQKFGTDKKCFRCGNQLIVSDLKEYKYLCLNCDENFYEFETLEREKKCVEKKYTKYLNN